MDPITPSELSPPCDRSFDTLVGIKVDIYGELKKELDIVKELVKKVKAEEVKEMLDKISTLYGFLANNK